jgi:hypothetical protein
MAIALPSPRLAPVTIAVFPFNSISFLLYLNLIGRVKFINIFQLFQVVTKLNHLFNIFFWERPSLNNSHISVMTLYQVINKCPYAILFIQKKEHTLAKMGRKSQYKLKDERVGT